MGVSIAFSPSASQSSLFYPRDHDECQPAEYSLLDGDEIQNMPLTNLIHDLA